MSYGTDDGLTAWLAQQGYALPADAPPPAVLRARASTYVDSYEQYWTGHRSDGVAQENAWPRTGATLNCVTAVPSDVTPIAIVTATYRAAWLEASNPGVLAGPQIAPGSRVKRQKVDVIEREFFDDGKHAVGSGPAFVDSLIDGLLGQFICDQKNAPFVWSLGS